MGYELFQKEPAVYILVLILNLLITIFAYGLFPFILAKARKEPISKKKYNWLCYGVNFAVATFFFLMSEDGGAMSLAPYLLWTATFSALGIKTLKNREVLLDETDAYEEPPTQNFGCAVTGDNGGFDEVMSAYAEDSAKMIEENLRAQPDNEDSVDFGLVPQKPIFTLGSMSVAGEKEYLDRLCTINGGKIKYIRRCSISVEGISGIIDVYDTFLLSGQPYKTIYINMYGAKASIKAPKGFLLDSSVNHKLSVLKGQTEKVRYCSRCGSKIDNDTKMCTGCRKQYFRGTKSLMVIVALVLVLVVFFSVCIAQYVRIRKANDTIRNLKVQITEKQSTITSLRKENVSLENENRVNWQKLNFYDNSAVIIGDDGTNVYHKYGCSKLNYSKRYWIHNVEYAEYLNYDRCPICND